VHRDDGRGSGSQRKSLLNRLIGARASAVPPPARALTALLAGAAFALAGCTSMGSSTNASDATPASSTTSAASSAGATPNAQSTGPDAESGCDSAIHDISTYGPSTVKLLADGREALNKAAVQLLVDGLDGAADAASSPQAKQDIKTLADAYDDYFDLTTDVVAIPLSTVLKDTANVEFVCR
jgi:hypothetical protein